MINKNNIIEINNLKDMLEKTGNLYGEREAYKLRIDKDKYKQINIDSPTGIWLIEYGIGFNIFEIIFNSKSTVLGSIFIVLGLLFALESAILEKRRKISDKDF